MKPLLLLAILLVFTTVRLNAFDPWVHSCAPAELIYFQQGVNELVIQPPQQDIDQNVPPVEVMPTTTETIPYPTIVVTNQQPGTIWTFEQQQYFFTSAAAVMAIAFTAIILWRTR